jgi:hypothetical protein
MAFLLLVILLCFLINAEALLEGHLGIAAPLLGSVLTTVEVVEIVHVAISFHLEGVKQVGTVPKLAVGW